MAGIPAPGKPTPPPGLKPGDRVVLRGHVQEIAYETVIIRLSDGPADLIAVSPGRIELETVPGEAAGA